MAVDSELIIPNKFELYDLINIVNKIADEEISFTQHDSFSARLHLKFNGEHKGVYVFMMHPEYGVMDEYRKKYYLADNISLSSGNSESSIALLKEISKYTEGYLIECDIRDEDEPDYVKFCEREKDDFVIEKTPEEKLLTNLSIINPKLITQSELFKDRDVFEKVVEHFKDYIEEKDNTPTPKI